MGGKLNVYNLGELGINRVLSPVQIRDGELLVCQNAVATPIGAQLALQKRPGMGKVNANVAAGTILSINNIPFGNPTGFGNNWQSSSTGLTITMTSVAFSPSLGMFVAVGPNAASGNAMRSTDGINWTAMSIASGRNQQNIIWSEADARFVAAGAPTGAGLGPISYSTDGINWTTPTAFTFGGQTRIVAYSPDLDRYVTANYTGTDAAWYYSSDLSSWTASNTIGIGSIAAQDIAWSPSLDLFCAVYGFVGGSQQAITSPDAITWTFRTTGQSAAWEAIHWSDFHSRFIAVASGLLGGTKQVITSSDGINWTGRDAANANQWSGLTETEEGRLVAVARNNASGAQVMISDDGGVTWSAVAAAANRDWRDVAYAQSLGLFVAVAFNGDPMYSE